MHEHPGVARAGGYLQASTAGMSTGCGALRRRCGVHAGGSHPLSGDSHGKQSRFDSFQSVRDMTTRSLRLDPQPSLASDRHTADVHAGDRPARPGWPRRRSPVDAAQPIVPGDPLKVGAQGFHDLHEVAHPERLGDAA